MTFIRLPRIAGESPVAYAWRSTSACDVTLGSQTALRALKSWTSGRFVYQAMDYKTCEITRAFLTASDLPLLVLTHVHHRRVCLSCLRESGSHPAFNQFHAVPFCLEHFEDFLSSCPACSRNLDWFVGRIDRCPDGCELLGRQAPRIDSDQADGRRLCIAVTQNLLPSTVDVTKFRIPVDAMDILAAARRLGLLARLFERIAAFETSSAFPSLPSIASRSWQDLASHYGGVGRPRKAKRPSMKALVKLLEAELGRLRYRRDLVAAGNKAAEWIVANARRNAASTS